MPPAAMPNPVPSDDRLANDPLVDAIESASEAFVIWDADDRLLFCNDHYRNFFAEPDRVRRGVPFDDLVEMNIVYTSIAEISLLPSGWDPDRYRTLRKACHAGAADTFIQLRDGRWLQSRERRTRAGGIVGIYSDITERMQTEMALAAAKRAADDANLAKSRFLAAASHDLRQPLHAVGILMSALQARLTTDRQTAIAAQIGDCLDTVTGLFDALLDISKLDAGVVAPTMTALPLAPVLRSLRREFGPLAQRKGLRLTVLDSRATARSDPAMLGRILRNLVSNAVKYTSAGRVLVGVRHTRHGLRIDVIDTGPGFDPAEAEAVFREFHRLDGAGSEQGIGLGLAIADRLARLLDHRLSVDTRPGHGTRFSLTLPRADAGITAATPPPPEHQPPRGLAGARLLMIDDDPDIRAAAAVLFDAWGCDTALAAGPNDLDAALARLDGPPDAVILDYFLKDGWTGARLAPLLTARLGHAVPMLMVTGETTPDLLREAQRLGFPVLHKPLHPMRLGAALRQMVGRGRSGRPEGTP